MNWIVSPVKMCLFLLYLLESKELSMRLIFYNFNPEENELKRESFRRALLGHSVELIPQLCCFFKLLILYSRSELFKQPLPL